MAKIIAKRGVKRNPIKRGYTYSDKTRFKSIGQLIDIVMQPGTNEKAMGEKRAAFKYLKLVYGLSSEDIAKRIEAKKEKRRRIEDIQSHFRGEKSAQEVAEKWKGVGYTPEKVHDAAIYLNLLDIPEKEVLRTRATSLNRSFMGKLAQEPMHTHYVVWSKVIEKINRVKNGTTTIRQFIDFLLDLAEDRPEFSAHIASILSSEDNLLRFINRNNPEEKYSFMGKSGRESRDKLLLLLTERKMLRNKEFPVKERLKEVPSIEKKIELNKLQEEKKRFYKSSSDKKFDRDLYGEGIEEGPLDRRRRKRKVKIKRIRKKIVRKKPVKRCRCK